MSQNAVRRSVAGRSVGWSVRLMEFTSIEHKSNTVRGIYFKIELLCYAASRPFVR